MGNRVGTLGSIVRIPLASMIMILVLVTVA